VSVAGAAPVAVVFGTRPEIVKLADLIRRLGAGAAVINTGQHWDDAMSGAFLRHLGVQPTHHLEIGGRSRGEQIGDATAGLTRLLGQLHPAAVVVQGDTNSALAGALAANALEVPLVHLEAGLRSFDRRMPEEHNRVVVDHLADLCLAPTEANAANLRAEQIPDERIAVIGNTVVEAVRRLLPAVEERAAILARFGLEAGRFVLATVHRPENTDGDALGAVLAALAAVPAPVVLPLHPRTAARIAAAGLAPLLAPLRVVEPLPYEPFLGLLAECGVAVSDSGGVQEEVSVLGRPVVVVRRSTERPEVQGTWAQLVDPGPQVAAAVADLWTDLPALHARLAALPSPYGDGTASAQAELAIAGLLDARGRSASG
jgi:UDP-N-acetylglucosamine 2-epimerase (non-hydrolysing)